MESNLNQWIIKKCPVQRNLEHYHWAEFDETVVIINSTPKFLFFGEYFWGKKSHNLSYDTLSVISARDERNQLRLGFFITQLLYKLLCLFSRKMHPSES